MICLQNLANGKNDSVDIIVWIYGAKNGASENMIVLWNPWRGGIVIERFLVNHPMSILDISITAPGIKVKSRQAMVPFL